jgi:ADP-ribose pyrophosphatase
MSFEIVDSKVVYSGKFVKVRIDTVRGDDKKVFEREIVESGRGVLVAALTDENKIVLIKQNRHNHGEIYEVPAGSMKEGEKPLEAAKRELKEETGLEAKNWKLISTHHNGVHDEGHNYYFLADSLSQSSTSFDEDERISPYEKFTFDEVRALMDKDKIIDLRSRGCIWLAELLLIKDINPVIKK